MLPRLLTERERPLVRALQTTRTLIAMMIATVVIALLIQADPDHHLAFAFLAAAHDWAHAVFPTLIK